MADNVLVKIFLDNSKIPGTRENIFRRSMLAKARRDGQPIASDWAEDVYVRLVAAMLIEAGVYPYPMSFQ